MSSFWNDCSACDQLCPKIFWNCSALSAQGDSEFMLFPQ